MDEQHIAALRQQMLLEIAADTLYTRERIGNDTLDARVMEVMGSMPRHEFVPVELQPYAYLNRPLPIGYEKTVSQPFIVALMTALLAPEADDVVLEVGAGAGYQAAILAELTKRVYTVDIIEELARGAERRLKRLGYENVEVAVANGYYGWPQHAPYDRIMVTAASDLTPPPLLAQSKPGGRMVTPTGIPDKQTLMLVEKPPSRSLSAREILPVRFSELEDPGETVGAA